MKFVNDEVLNDIMTNAIEGGCAYWMNNQEDVKSVSVKRDAKMNIIEIICTHNVDGEGWQTTKIGATEIRNALEKAVLNGEGRVTRRMKSLLTDPEFDSDANDADIAIQLTIFGQVVFG